MPDDATTPPPVGATAGRARFGMAIVRGGSMVPTLAAGDRLLVGYRRRPRPDDLVLARFPDGLIVVKRAAERRGGGWWLTSDQPSIGVDSRHRGVIADDAVLGVVLARLWPRPRLRW
ncbi:S24 family peptidase [Nocardioides sp. R-C-SC26]|uniref:S24 family peptidase n=1 Tax=Nocardioides sp. R-C-SC26 TaxID=2870414 RepID=UPI001E4D8B3B|nr:S24 family peptidase [Nocardioides sp. R-C-SC26]